jgi:hypothetical protein
MEEFINGEFFEWVDRTAEKLRSFVGERVTVVHHNDADGICSGAILSRLCEFLGYEAELICIEKVYPAVVEKIHEGREGGVIIYTDLGGLAAEMIEKIDEGRNIVFIIDHHPAKSIESDHVFVLDPELAGISGDIFVSASTLNYIFCKRIRQDMCRYAYLAVVGSVGDYHDRSGGILGFDRFALDDAIHMGQVKVKIEGTRERYYIEFFGEYAGDVARRLTNLGAVGYERRGYRRGVKACLEGFDDETLREAEELEELKTEKFREAIEYLKDEGLNQGKHVQWFHLHDMFSPMGVKAVGEFCQLIKDMTFVDENKYLIGFQNIPKEIPDLGKIEWKAVKMSGRVPIPLERKIFHGYAPGLDVLVPEASEAVGGFADATHKIAAATVIDMGKEEKFVEAFEELVDEFIKNVGGNPE